MIKLKRGVISQAATELGITRATIYSGIRNKRLDVIRKLYELQTKANEEHTVASKLYTKLQRT